MGRACLSDRRDWQRQHDPARPPEGLRARRDSVQLQDDAGRYLPRTLSRSVRISADEGVAVARVRQTAEAGPIGLPVAGADISSGSAGSEGAVADLGYQPQRSEAVRRTKDVVSSLAVALPEKLSQDRPCIGSSANPMAITDCGLTK